MIIIFYIYSSLHPLTINLMFRSLFTGANSVKGIWILQISGWQPRWNPGMDQRHRNINDKLNYLFYKSIVKLSFFSLCKKCWQINLSLHPWMSSQYTNRRCNIWGLFLYRLFLFVGCSTISKIDINFSVTYNEFPCKGDPQRFNYYRDLGGTHSNRQKDTLPLFYKDC